MTVPGVHPPDPDDPKGMAFVFAAGFPDPRPGGYPKKTYPNQPLVLKQGWEPTSQMFWDLGLRYHPELATKWVKGGGQFTVGELVSEKPEPATDLSDPSELHAQADAMAKDQFSKIRDEVERVKREGTDEERAAFRRQFAEGMQRVAELAKLIEDEESKD